MGIQVGGSGKAHAGGSEQRLKDLYRSCDVIMNVVGATDLRDEHMAVPLRVYVECDQ